MSTSTNPKAVEAKNRGNTLFKEGRHNEAIQAYSEAIRLDPNDYAFYTNRATCYSSLNKHQEALADADRAVQLKEDWMKGHYRRGVALAALGRWEDAIAPLRRALQLEPNNQDVATRLREAETEARSRRRPGQLRGYEADKEEGNELYKQGKYDDAAAAYTRAYQQATTTEQKATVLSNRAAAYSQQKFYDKVMRDCNEVLELDPEMKLPTTLKALVRRGLAYEDAEKWEDALQDMQRVVARSPAHKQASDGIVRLKRNLEMKKKLRQQEKFHA